MYEDRAVLKAFGEGDVQISHIVPMQLTHFLLHLKPLAIITMQRVDPTKRFHREIENQLEVGDKTC